MKRASGETTVPIASTHHPAPAETSRIAIQWVFPEAKLSTVHLDRGGRIELGRQEDCGIALPSGEVSRSHAEIRREGPIWTIRDLGSRNGVFVAGRRVSEAPIEPGDLIRLGDWIGVLLSAAPTPDAPGEFGPIAPGLYGGRLLRERLRPLERAASSDLPIVVEGETGTGKEWTARAIHQWSGRTGPFLAVNCAALPEGLAEAELFGYRKGAFTGADRASPGYFRAAQGGTLLLDEIVDLPLGLQGKLLRVLEQREVSPLGEPNPVPIDVRVVAAAQEPLKLSVDEKRFRADLCARLDGLTVRLPPLRERAEDVVGLFQLKLRDHAKRAPALEWRLVERLCLYDWPFNVREVDLLARRMVILHGEEPVLLAAHLPERIQRAAHAPEPAAPSSPPEEAPDPGDRDEQDMMRLLAGLRRHRGNVARAAADAKISRQRAYRIMGARPDLNWREGGRARSEPPADS